MRWNCAAPLLFASFTWGGLHAWVQEPSSSQPAVSVTFVMNYGYLLEAGEHKVLIDGLFRGAVPSYGVVPRQTRDAIESGTGSFADIDLLLVSHFHGDHFDAQAVAAHLEANKKAELLTSEQVAKPVRAALGKDSPALARIRTFAIEYGAAAQRLTAAGVPIQIRRVSHGTGRRASIENFGFLLDLDGIRVAHFGDMVTKADVFASWRLLDERVDLALVPYWYLLSESSRPAITDHLKAKQLVAGHIPPAEIASVREKLDRVLPGTWTFERSLESREFRRD